MGSEQDPTFPTWGLPVRKSMTQSQSGAFRLRFLSLENNVRGAMVLKAPKIYEQHSHIVSPVAAKVGENGMQDVGGPVWMIGKLK